MLNDKLITVIIPVYNASRFLAECLDSVLAQSYQCWELIAVNDGSKDDSLDILRDYANKDSRIKMIDKQNEGVSVARNTALAEAKGEYIFFADADDLLYPDALQLLMETMEQFDVTLVKADFRAINSAGCEAFVNKRKVIRRQYAGHPMLADRFAKKVVMGEYFLWTCLFRRDIIEKNNIRFIEGVRLMEDAAFITDYLCHSERNIYLCEAVYDYRKYEGAATTSQRDYTADLQKIKAHLTSDDKPTKILLQLINKTLANQPPSSFQRKLMNAESIISRVNLHVQYLLHRRK